MSGILVFKNETNLVHHAGGPVFPSEMKEAILASSENYSSFDGTGFNDVGVFAAKSPASFEGEKDIGHVQKVVLWSSCGQSRRDARSIKLPRSLMTKELDDVCH